MSTAGPTSADKPLRIMLSCDMEGLHFIRGWSDCTPGSRDWLDLGRPALAAQVEAAVAGMVEATTAAGRDIHVFVIDAHWASTNLDAATLAHLPVTLVQGDLYRMSMVPAVQEMDGLALLGGHARPQMGYAMGHAVNGGTDFWIVPADGVADWSLPALSGKRQCAAPAQMAGQPLDVMESSPAFPIGETGLNMLAAASAGVPTIAMQGDASACREARRMAGRDLPVSSAGKPGRQAAEADHDIILDRLKSAFRDGMALALANDFALSPELADAAQCMIVQRKTATAQRYAPSGWHEWPGAAEPSAAGGYALRPLAGEAFGDLTHLRAYYKFLSPMNEPLTLRDLHDLGMVREAGPRSHERPFHQHTGLTDSAPAHTVGHMEGAQLLSDADLQAMLDDIYPAFAGDEMDL